MFLHNSIQQEESSTNLVFLPKTQNLNLIVRIYQTNPLRDLLKNNPPIIFRSVKVMKVKGGMKNCS
jgi:hypothetical protein